MAKGREGFSHGNEAFVYHSVDGKPTNPNPYHTLYLAERKQNVPDLEKRKAPRKRFAVTKSNEREASVASCTSMSTESCAKNLNVYVALQFFHFTLKRDVQFYIGLPQH